MILLNNTEKRYLGWQTQEIRGMETNQNQKKGNNFSSFISSFPVHARLSSASRISSMIVFIGFSWLFYLLHVVISSLRYPIQLNSRPSPSLYLLSSSSRCACRLLLGGHSSTIYHDIILSLNIQTIFPRFSLAKWKWKCVKRVTSCAKKVRQSPLNEQQHRRWSVRRILSDFSDVFIRWWSVSA